MGKAINAFVEKSTDSDTRVIKLSILDFNDRNGVHEKTVVKQRNRDPQVKVVVEIREVTYLREIKIRDEEGTRYETLVTKGYETVKEVSVSRADHDERVRLAIPTLAGEVTRDLRKPREQDARKNDIW